MVYDQKRRDFSHENNEKEGLLGGSIYRISGQEIHVGLDFVLHPRMLQEQNEHGSKSFYVLEEVP